VILNINEFKVDCAVSSSPAKLDSVDKDVPLVIEAPPSNQEEDVLN
jgi:hypothetical protein